MIRILQVTDALKQRYGITNVIMNYYRNINRENVQFDFLVNYAEDDLEKEIKDLGGYVYYFEELSLSNFFKCKQQVDSFFKENGFKYTAVHSHFLQLDFIVLKSAKKYGIKHRISHAHATKFSAYRLRAFRNKLMFSLGVKYVTDYFACGMDAGQSIFGSSIIQSDSFYVLKNAILIDKFIFNEKMRCEVRKLNRWDSDSCVVGVVGSLSDRKNQAFIIQLMPELLRKNNNVRLVLLGDGEIKDELKQLAESLGVYDKITFKGTVRNVYDYLQSIDCFVLPSKLEGLPLSVVEAETASLKCVVSDVVTREVNINNLCAFCNLNEKDKWIKSILDSFDNQRRDMRDIIVNEGYSLKEAADLLTKKYESMV